MVKPWLDAGYEALTIDLKPSELSHPKHTHLVEDVRGIGFASYEKSIAIIFAFPPCTHLAVSGARWFKEKGLSALITGLSIVEACREICEGTDSPWMIENPVGTLSTYWREPDYTFDPCDYGDPYTKKTCIWCGNGFVMPPIVRENDMFAEATAVEPSMGSMMHKMAPSAERGDLRSVTPMGFAQAVFRANSGASDNDRG